MAPNLYRGVFDHWHEAYERGRPGWPREVVEVAGIPPQAGVLELGAGTGKLTRLLVERFAHVTAVEPDEGMRSLLGPLCPTARVVDGAAESIPLGDGSADAVFSAEAFHHFDHPRALGEIARVLRPGGALVLMWNLAAGPVEPSIEAVERLLAERGPSRGEIGYDPMDLDHIRYASDAWRSAFAGAPFEELRDERLANEQLTDADGLVALLASMGWVSELLDADRDALLGDVRALLTAPAYRRSWETRVTWTRLLESHHGTV